MTRVLIVDDHEENLAYLHTLLRAHRHEVTQARHGAEALTYARKDPPELVVSDLLMPVMDGYTLLRHWRADPALQTVPFIVCSATYTDVEDERLAIDLGADAFLLKPSEPEEVMRVIDTVLARSRTEGVGVSTLGGVRQDGVLKHYSETLIRKLEEKTLQLERANAEQRLLLESIPHIMWIAAPDGTNTGFNQRWMDYTGLTAEESLAHGYVHLIHPDDREDAAAAWEHATKTHEPFEATYRLRRADGHHRWMLGLALPFRDATGAVTKWIGTCTDIHDLRELEAQLLRVQRLESIGTLAGGIAHDLNNLLAPIVAGTELLRSLELDGEAREIVEGIDASAQRGTALVRTLLSHAAGDQEPRRRLRIDELVESVCSLLASTFPPSISVQSDVAEDLHEVVGDRTQLDQVLINLCVNARDAMPDGGNLCISARNGDGPVPSVHLEVRDDGSGIAPELIDRIFEPFLTTKERDRGTGLGLSTAAGIVESHGGTIEVTSELGGGSTFRVVLPAAGAPSVRIAPPVAPPPTAPRSTGPRVVVIDDEPAIVEIARRALEGAGCTVTTATTGIAGVEAVARDPEAIDAVVTDLRLPGMRGTEVVAAIRALRPNLPIVAVSGMATPEVERWAAANDLRLLAKPYGIDELLELVTQVLPHDEQSDGSSGSM